MENTVGNNTEAIETFTYKTLKLTVEWHNKRKCKDCITEMNKAIKKIEGIDEIIEVDVPLVVVTCIADFDAQILIDKLNSIKRIEKTLLEHESTPITITLPRKNKALLKVVKGFKDLLGHGGASGSSDAKMEK